MEYYNLVVRINSISMNFTYEVKDDLRTILLTVPIKNSIIHKINHLLLKVFCFILFKVSANTF